VDRPARSPQWLTAGIVAGLPLLFVVGSYLWWREQLPDPMPSHWNASGEVDDTVSLAGTFVTMVVIAGAGALLAWGGALAFRLTWSVRRVLVVIGAAVGGFGAGLWLTVATLALGLTDPYQAREPTWQIPALLVAIVLVPAVTLMVLGRAPARSAATDRPAPDLPRAPLPAGEPVWREAFFPSAWFVVFLVILFGLGTALALILNIWAGFPVLVVALVCGLLATSQITVDQRGLQIGLGPWNWPRITVRLAEIVSAEVTEVHPFEWGGWGYRVRPGGRALALRRGPGVRLVLSEEREFVVNSRAPERMAGLVNALLERVRQ
jgi:MFS family permease